MTWKFPKKEWDDTLEVNLTGTFLFSKYVLPTMREKAFGRIINISSVVGQIGIVGTSAYAASKAGMMGLTKTMAREVITKGITVNCLALGYFEAGMFLSLKSDIQEFIKKSIPMKRLGRPQELVHSLKFLIHEDSSYITGETININGGFYM